MECFLDRLARSPYADRFVLKGGVLLAAYEMRRPTRDVDLRADRLAANPAAVLDAVRRIAAFPIEDGTVFGVDGARAEVIRDEDEYNGVRVTMTVELASARMAFHVDVNVGDPVVPDPETVVLPRLRGGALTLLGYPLAMVYAEKIVTMLERGEANTRWRDFADVYLLCARHGADGDELVAAMEAVAKHRGAPLRERCSRNWTALLGWRSSSGPPGCANSAWTTGCRRTSSRRSRESRNSLIPL